MPSQLLIRSVEECLHAGAFLYAQRERGEDVEGHLQRTLSARAELRKQIATMQEPKMRPLVDATRAYLAAEEAFEGAAGDVQSPARVLEKLHQARRELTAQLREYLSSQCDTATPPDANNARPLPLSRRILIAIDGSTPSTWALEFAGQLAEALCARVLLLHVIEPLTSVADDLVFATPALQEEHREHCRLGSELLERSRSALLQPLLIDTLLRVGSPVAEIIHAARSWEADLIVMGTRGRGRLTQFLLGSVAEAVIREAPCPVLTIGREAKQLVGAPQRERRFSYPTAKQREPSCTT